MERVLVTGAGRGLGLEFTRQWAGRGARVFAGFRDAGRSRGLQELAAAHPRLVEPVELDVTEAESLQRAYHQIAARVDALDVLINNAGVDARNSNAGSESNHEVLGDLDAARMLEVFEVNAVAPVMMAQRFLRLLRKGSRPRVVNLSSMLGSFAVGGSGSYSYDASKAALNMLTRHLARDLAGEGITAVVVHPGWVRTDMGGPRAPLHARDSVAGLMAVIDRLELQDAGKFYRYDGEIHPW